MTEILKNLCNLDGVSGDESAVSDFIISQIDGFCDWKKDSLGNIIVHKNGKNTPKHKVMLDAHTDEVGLIICGITNEGFLKFHTVGGIETSSLMLRTVRFKNGVTGAISGKPIHLLDSSARKKLPSPDTLYIDIGASSKEEAEKYISVGDTAVICGEYLESGDSIISKALDDRVGCAVLIDLIKNYDEYGFYASFSVQEEVGLRGAKTSAFAIEPEFAIVLEATTAKDTGGVSEEDSVCDLGCGVAVSFMDRATVYDRKLYDTAIKSGIPAQPKRTVAGGNDSGAVHLSKEGVRTIALSLPCRYIHSPSSVANKNDLMNLRKLAEYMLSKAASGDIDDQPL